MNPVGYKLEPVPTDCEIDLREQTQNVMAPGVKRRADEGHFDHSALVLEIKSCLMQLQCRLLSPISAVVQGTETRQPFLSVSRSELEVIAPAKEEMGWLRLDKRSLCFPCHAWARPPLSRNHKAELSPVLLAAGRGPVDESHARANVCWMMTAMPVPAADGGRGSKRLGSDSLRNRKCLTPTRVEATVNKLTPPKNYPVSYTKLPKLSIKEGKGFQHQSHVAAVTNPSHTVARGLEGHMSPAVQHTATVSSERSMARTRGARDSRGETYVDVKELLGVVQSLDANL
ncbi:hypothetical protein EYF80_015645 [Liparis tanakae]|uniref:Uncharacterized protein n=1 Tax=Liparis tanakae TaxID=230148 RepID=A0A4Z2I8J8_9TELE|nr:hypothetical protein EYF80_015645 [Liparis tanakae]